MLRLRSFALTLSLVGSLLTAGSLEAQDPTPGVSPSAPELIGDARLDTVPASPAAQPRSFRSILRVGGDFTLPPGERVREVVSVTGSVVIDGEVDLGVVIVLGTLHLGPNALVEGEVVAFGTDVSIDPGAIIRGGLVVVGGVLTAPDGFSPDRESIIVGGGDWITSRIRGLVPFFTRGLLWGRLIVPDLPGMWWIVGLVFLIHTGLGLLFPRPVGTCRTALRERPFASIVAGLGVLLAIGPATFLLAVSLVGLPVIPVLGAGVLIAALIGKVGLAALMGSALISESEEGSRMQLLRSVAIGSAILLVAYMIPLLGLAVWGIGSTVGLGAATLAFLGGLKKELPRQAPGGEPAAPPPDPPTPNTPPPGSGPGSAQLSSPGPQASASASASPAGLLSMPRAKFSVRLAAFLIDVLLVGVIALVLNVDNFPQFVIFLFAYHVLFWTLKAVTAGGIICNLRLVRTDGSPPNLGDSLIRGFASVFSIAAAGAGCFWILVDPERQSWHDRLAGTYVVKVPRSWPT